VGTGKAGVPMGRNVMWSLAYYRKGVSGIEGSTPER